MNSWIRVVTERHLKQMMYNAFIVAAVLVLLVFSLIHRNPDEFARTTKVLCAKECMFSNRTAE